MFRITLSLDHATYVGLFLALAEEATFFSSFFSFFLISELHHLFFLVSENFFIFFLFHVLFSYMNFTSFFFFFFLS